MRKLLHTLTIVVGLALASGCCSCPSETRYIFLPQLGNFVKFPQGFFDDEANTYSEEEYQDVLKKWQEQINKEWERYQRSLDDKEI